MTLELEVIGKAQKSWDIERSNVAIVVVDIAEKLWRDLKILY